MHEVSIATGLIGELVRIAGENRARKVITVNIKIGKMSGIVTDSLKFAFDALKTEQPLLSDTEINIQEVPLRYECRDCRVSFRTEELNFPCCPECKSYRLTLLTGEEMNIENMEIEV
ncbi:hydrogenase maturation nickel metallochaperone HypA [bacterium]|nr:MAG: hydrogenase maturation nickel metallochaperone HypA [bacterium]